MMTIPSDTVAQMFDNLTTAVLFFDSDLRLSCMNSAAEDLLCASSKRLAGQSYQDVLSSDGDLQDRIRRARETGVSYAESELEIATYNSHTIKVDCKITPLIRDDQHNEVIVELINANVLQRMLRGESLSVQQDVARQSLRGMAHEIKNPLGGIRGAAQLLQSELNKSDPELVEYTHIIIQEADRLRRFIDQMLTGDKQKQFEWMNIHEALEYVCNLVLAEFEGEYSIIRDYDPSLPVIALDKEKIIQALLNIVRNALQVIDKDNGVIQIRTRVLRKVTLHKTVHRHVVRIEIIDNGPGIPPEIEKSLFFPLITARAEGTGLGLSIAQSLIAAHNGIVEYERRDAHTVFSIYIPMEQDNDHE